MKKLNLTDIVNYLFINRVKYKTLSIDDKKYFFFIINRYLSKIYPKQAQEFNIKGIDESICMDLWFVYLNGKNLMKEFWSKPKITKISEREKIDKELLIEFEIKEEDYLFLNKYHKELLDNLLED